jgi:hypothetical protein
MILIVLLLTSITVQAQRTVLFLPIILKSGDMAIDPQLIITDGTIEIDMLQGGWKLADPYWNPQIAQYKGGGTFVNAQLAEGRRMVHREYDNVIETIPLSLRGTNQAQAMKTANEALALLRQAGDYWTEPYEYDPVWTEIKLPCDACLTGYSRIIKGTIPELTNPFGQPFFSIDNQVVMEGITLTIEREPFWQITKPGTIIGPLYNLIDNPDFELWNFGIEDSQPDSWTDIETTHIAGQNSRDQAVPKFGQSDLKIRVSGSTLAGASKGVTQVVTNTEENTEYTVIAWVRSEGVSNGVGRILINYASQLELYRDSVSHGWTLYTGKITTGVNDIVSITLEILTTAANTDGTIYIDSLMFVKGDWEQEAADNILPYMSGGNIVNHWDQDFIVAGDINYVDAWNVPGNVDSLIRLEFINKTTPADVSDPDEVFSELRVGMRRTRNVFQFQNFQDPGGPVDTASSSDNRIESGSLSADWQTVFSFTIDSSDITSDNAGRFKLLTRIFDTLTSGPSTLEIRAKYWIGASGINTVILNAETPAVLNAWTTVDLTSTKAISWDLKLFVDVPNSLGVEIQMRRTSGTDEAYLDYAMLLPTDGGVLLASIDPPIAQDSGLIIDNTGFSDNNVYGLRVPSIWRPVYETSPTLPTGTGYRQRHLAEYNSDLYISTIGGDIHRYRASTNSGQLLHSFGLVGEVPMVVYGGKLFLFSNRVNPLSFQAYSTKGSVFPGDEEFQYGIANAQDAIVVGGRIYIGTSFAGADGRLLEWDGSAATATLLVQDVTSAGFNKLIYYAGKIYIAGQRVGTNIRDVYSYDITSGTYQLEFDTGVTGTEFSDMVIFQDKLYMVIGGQELFSFDGQTWETQTPEGAAVRFHGLGTIGDERLFAGGENVGVPDQGLVIMSLDGTTWQTVYEPESATVERFEQFTEAGGDFYGGTRTDTSDLARLHSVTFRNQQYKISDFSGTPFLAPPRTRNSEKRHRYVFSYDRKNFINSISDSALIGIGFVPRYLEPPMKEN